MKNRLYKNALESIPYILFPLIIFNFPLSIHVSSNIYKYLAYLIFGCMILLFLLKKKHIDKIYYGLLTYIFFLLLVFLIQLITGTYYNLGLAVGSLIAFIWVPSFVFLYVILNHSFNLVRFIKYQLFIASIVGILGIIQYHYNYSIFGLIREYEHLNLYQSGFLNFRSASVLYSAQVYGLFMTLYGLTAFEFRKHFKYSYFGIILSIFLMISSLYSGNRLSTILVIIYILYKMLNNSKISYFLKTLTLAISLFMMFIFYSDFSSIKINNPTIDRTFHWIQDFKGFRSNQEKTRFKIYSDILEKTHIVGGNGMGSTAPKKGAGRFITSESYLLKIYSEAGIIAVILFVFVFFQFGYKSYFNNNLIFIIIAVTFFSLIFVHAFISPVFFGIWILILFSVQPATQNNHVKST